MTDETSFDDRIARAAARLTERAARLEATYRLQFHAGFTFRDARAIAGYLAELGVSHAYASPFLKAVPGSTHGYDIVDHGRFNPEIGDEADFLAWSDALRHHDLGLILDVVPNHMGILGGENPWWDDVLENGRASAHAASFDIDWSAPARPAMQGRVLLPLLGDAYGAVLESGDLKVEPAGDGAFRVAYHEHRIPLDPGSYAAFLEPAVAALEDDPTAEAEGRSILTAIRNLPAHTEADPDRADERRREKEVIKRRIAAWSADGAVALSVGLAIAAINGKPGDPASFDALDRLLEAQPYRLASWRVASDEINYRRFFDINGLAAISMERPEVFEAAHALVLRLLGEGRVDGLRIDHPDGLFDPKSYFRRLQERALIETACAGGDDPRDAAEPAGAPLYVVAEKILGPAERLPADWAVHGTSGYDALNVINGLFVDTRNDRAFARLYREWTEDDARYTDLIYENKRLVLQASLASELHMLARQADALAQRRRATRDFTFNGLRHALREVIAGFPVYRSYIGPDGTTDDDRKAVASALRRAAYRNPTTSSSLFRFLRDLLLGDPSGPDPAEAAERLRFVGKFQQVTSPVTAKGIEDTVFYVYNRLVSLNEVGGEPARFGTPPEAAHAYFLGRRADWPRALTPLSTHDTKRSADVRARINVLSEMPDAWAEAVVRWGRLNDRHRPVVEDAPAPDRNEEYLLYQTLLGAWPQGPLDDDDRADFEGRIRDYMIKALREAKVHSSWINPSDEYDEAIRQFVGRILDPDASAEFLEDLGRFARRVARLGLFNGLSQALIALAAPGVPDLYQGTEIWDFSLVDPDNRRPVDYERRRALLLEIRGKAEADPAALARELLASRGDGRAKLYVTWRALQARRCNPGLFTGGDYLPAGAEGDRADHLFAFARLEGGRAAVVAVPRLIAGLVGEADDPPTGPNTWGDTRLILPPGLPGRFRDLFTGAAIEARDEGGRATLPVARLLADFPLALLLAE